MRGRYLLPLVLLAAMSGCAADFTEPWDVIEPRLMGARIEVEGEPTRPRPRLGERFTIDQYLALPTPKLDTSPRYELMVALCLGQRAPSGALTCFGEQQLTPEVTRVSDIHLRLSNLAVDLSALLGDAASDLPATFDPTSIPALRELDRLVLFGVLCTDAKPERVPGKSINVDAPSALFRCVPDAPMVPFPDASTFTLSVLLDRGLPEDQNRNPSFACDPAEPDSACAVGVPVQNEAQMGGPLVLVYPPEPMTSGPRRVVPWPAYEPVATQSAEGCASDPQLLQVRAGTDEHVIRARFDASDRESYMYEVEQNGTPTVREKRESLLLAHVISAHGGEMERYSSELSPEDLDRDAEISVEYTPPEVSDEPEERIPEAGRRVRFYFTLRDQRGGVDFMTRELCVLPGMNQE